MTLRITAEREDVQPIIDRAYRELSSRLSIPGFRKGKIPRKVIDSHLGKETVEEVMEEALKNGIPSLYLQGVRESGIFPVSDPEIENFEIEDSGAVVFDARVDVKPEIEVKDYVGLSVEKPETEVTEEDLQRALDEARDHVATLEVVEGRPVQEGDYVLFDYKAFADGVPLEGSSGSDVMIEMGSEDFLEGFDEQLMGARKGDILDVVVTFPPDYGERELAGKPGTFRTIIKEIKRKSLPPLDDSLAAEISKFDTLEEFKEDLRKRIGLIKKSSGEQLVRAQAIKALVDQTYIDLPDSMVEREVQREIEEFGEELQNRGITLEEYLGAMKGGRHELEKAIREKVKGSLREELALDAVASAEDIDVSDEEAEEYITERVRLGGGDPKKVLKQARKEGRIPLVKANLRLQKAVEFLADNVVFAGESDSQAEELPTEEEAEGEAEEADEAVAPKEGDSPAGMAGDEDQRAESAGRGTADAEKEQDAGTRREDEDSADETQGGAE